MSAYIAKKSENQATKEDIGAITTEIEQVKAAFTNETEKLKSNLQLITNIQLGINSEERNSIINFGLKLNSLIHILTDISLDNCNTESNEELTDYKKRIGLCIKECYSHGYSLGVLCMNETIRDTSLEVLSVIVSNLSTPINYYIKELKDINDYEIAEDQGHRENLIESHKMKYFAEIKAGNKIVKPQMEKFQKESRHYLYCMIKA